MDKGTGTGGGARGEDYAGSEVHERLRAERGLELGVQEAEMAKLWSHTESTEITERLSAHRSCGQSPSEELRVES